MYCLVWSDLALEKDMVVIVIVMAVAGYRTSMRARCRVQKDGVAKHTVSPRFNIFIFSLTRDAVAYGAPHIFYSGTRRSTAQHIFILARDAVPHRIFFISS